MYKTKTINLTLVHVLAVLILTASCSSSPGVQSEEGVLQGRYTAEQAERGRISFNKACGRCHVPRQFSQMSERAGGANAWIMDYYDFIRISMPEDAPGSLSDDIYQDIMAYLLSLNNVKGN